MIVKDSTPVRLRLISNLTSRHLRLDDQVQFEVLEDVVVENDPSSGCVIAVSQSTNPSTPPPVVSLYRPVTSGCAAGRFLVIPRETTASGTITDVNPTRLMGRYGTVEVALDGVKLANGDKIALRGTERADRHIRPGLLVFLTAPVGLVVQPKDPVWLTPMGRDAIIKDGRDFKVWTDCAADLDSSEFEQR